MTNNTTRKSSKTTSTTKKAAASKVATVPASTFAVDIELGEATGMLHQGVLVLSFPRHGHSTITDDIMGIDPKGSTCLERFGEKGVSIAGTKGKPIIVKVLDTASEKEVAMKVKLSAFLFLDDPTAKSFRDDSKVADKYQHLASVSEPVVAITKSMLSISVPVAPRLSTTGASTSYHAGHKSIKAASLGGHEVLVKLEVYVSHKAPGVIPVDESSKGSKSGPAAPAQDDSGTEVPIV